MFVSVLKAIAGSSRALWSDRRGNFAIFAALAAFPVMFTVGGAVDLNMYYTHRIKIQNASDAAALAAARRFVVDPDDARLQQFAQDYFDANIGSLYRAKTALDYQGTKINEDGVRELTIDVEFSYDPVFLPLMAGQFAGLDGKSHVKSVIAIGNTTVEMAMVLDTSGSMEFRPAAGGEKKIDSLRTIASDSIKVLFDASAMAGIEDPVRVSIVPFAGSVNLGVKLDTPWLDPKGLHPNHHDHLFWDRYNYTSIPIDYREPPVGQAGSESWRNPAFQANQIAIRDPRSTLPLRQRPWVRKDNTAVYLTRQYLLANMGSMEAPVFNQSACPLSRPDWESCIWTGSNASWSARNLTGGSCSQAGNAADPTCHPPYTLRRTSQYFPHSSGANPRVCAEARTGPYDLTDQPPRESDPESLFLPYFAPDEYQVNNQYYLNNYLADAAWKHPFGSTPLQSADWQLQQNDVRKYLMRPERLQAGLGTNNARSPYYSCESDAIVPLSSDSEVARQRVRNLTASGSTNVEEGLGWGWRTLTAGEPFAGGRAHGDENNFKTVVVMTDGANTYYQNGNASSGSRNYSGYGAYGFSRDERIFRGTTLERTVISSTSYTPSEMTRAMDQRTARLCENVKNDGRVPVKTARGEQVVDGSNQPVSRDGVLIYTIAFDIPAADKARVDKLLQDCASATIADQMAGRPLAQSQKYFYSAANNAQLAAAFNDIIASLTALRIAR